MTCIDKPKRKCNELKVAQILMRFSLSWRVCSVSVSVCVNVREAEAEANAMDTTLTFASTRTTDANRSQLSLKWGKHLTEIVKLYIRLEVVV